MKIYLRPYIIILAIICVISCLGTEADLLNNHFPPKVSTDEAEISEKMIQVILNGSYEQSETSSYIDECGFYYGPDAKLTSSEKIVATDRAGDFSTNVTPEDYGIRYYYKAYISNDRSELTSSTKSFQMPDFDHFVRFVSFVISSEDGDVTVSSSVEVASGITITEAGILYSKDPEVTFDDERITSPNYQDLCVEITNLTIGERYYMCSYVKSGKYVAYSGIVEFTPYSVPTLTTTDITEIECNSAVAGGKDISGNGLEIISKGVVWSTKANPTIELETKTENGSGKEEFVANVIGLSRGTKYYLRAYAVNSDGVGYGNEITFETLSQSIASVTTTTPSEVTSTSAISGGNVTSDGGAEVTMRGVVWGKEHNPTISLDTKTADNSGIGKFTSAITGLEPETKYYLRAYAVNSEGVSYGNEITFKTLLKGDCYIDEYGVDHGKGTEIDGVVWAPVNCGYHEADFKYGKLYQWGRKYGQGYDGDLYDINGNKTGTYTDTIVPTLKPGPVSLGEGQSKSNEKYFYYVSYSNFDCDWLSSSNADLWGSGLEYDPCPDGWRVPTYKELDRLKSDKLSWATENDQVGYWFSGSATYSSSVPRVFFPAAGIIYGNNGEATGRGLYGYYWSSDAGIALNCHSYANGLVFKQGSSWMERSYDRAGGWSVRCVKE